MKLVTAVVRQEAVDAVQIALARFGIKGMTVTEVSGYARQLGHTEVYRGTEVTIDFNEKVKLEILATDEEAPGIVATIVAAGRTGIVGDGKVWTIPVEDVVRIRTGETGPGAV